MKFTRGKKESVRTADVFADRLRKTIQCDLRSVLTSNYAISSSLCR